MNEVKLTVQAPKEVVDYLQGAFSLVQKLVNKEPLGQLVLEEFAVVQKLYNEFAVAKSQVTSQTDEVIDAAELFGRRIAYLILGKEVVPVVVS